MRTPNLRVVLLAAVLAASSAMAGESVPIDQLDAGVVDAIKNKFEGAELLSASRETDDDKPKHEVKIRHHGQVWEVDVADNGEILEMEREDDDQRAPR
jgi:uncharacterized membrane protein YkoI